MSKKENKNVTYNRVNPLNPEFFVTQKRLVSESRHG